MISQISQRTDWWLPRKVGGDGGRILVPQPGIAPMPPALGAPGLDRWTAGTFRICSVLWLSNSQPLGIRATSSLCIHLDFYVMSMSWPL